MVEVSTSILSVKPENAIATFYNLEVAKTDYFHIDVMDGEFVKNNTIDKMETFCTYIKQISNIPLDVHLMVYNIKENIDKFIAYRPNIITFHIEACKNKEEVKELIKYIQNNNIRVGISIKPNTKIEELYEILPLVHLVLIMTVEPGEGGQKLITETVQKVKELNEYIKSNNIDIDLEADGGINLENKHELIKSGANILVAGSSIINSENFKQTIEEMKNI